MTAIRSTARACALLMTLLAVACGGGLQRGPSATPVAPTTMVSAPVPVVLTTARSGDGSGGIVSTPAGIDCGSSCSASFAPGTAVKLTSTPDTGSSFGGWSGACNGLDTCTLTLGSNQTVGALFSKLPVVAAPPVTTVPTVTPKACDAYTGPAVSSLKQYEGLTHEHSAYSDGDPHFIPADYFRIAQTAGYSFVGSSEHSDNIDDGLFVTLHASCDPSSGDFDPTQLEYCFLNPTGDKLMKWQSTSDQAKAASSATFLGIRGFEWTSDVFGHINVFFSQNFTNAKDDGGYALTMDTFWSWFTRDPSQIGVAGSPSSPVPFGGGSDGLATFNHPHDKCLTKSDPTTVTTNDCDWNDYALIPAAEPRMFAIEAYNDSNRDDRYQPYLTHALDVGWHLSFLGSEDEHFGMYAVEIRPKTVTLATSLTEAGFKEAWMSRRTYALTPGQHLRATQLADGAHPMGSHLACDAGAQVPLTVKVTQANGDPFTGEYQVFTNGGQLLAKSAGTEATFQLPVEAGKERWYFVRVHGPDGKSVAYLAPVWITAR